MHNHADTSVTPDPHPHFRAASVLNGGDNVRVGAPASVREAKFVTHDGAIWPVARRSMICGHHIIDRMAEDLEALLREHGEDACITAAHYRALGWRRDQIEAYGLDAPRRMAAHRVARGELV